MVVGSPVTPARRPEEACLELCNRKMKLKVVIIAFAPVIGAVMSGKRCGRAPDAFSVAEVSMQGCGAGETEGLEFKQGEGAFSDDRKVSAGLDDGLDREDQVSCGMPSQAAWRNRWEYTAFPKRSFWIKEASCVRQLKNGTSLWRKQRSLGKSGNFSNYMFLEKWTRGVGYSTPPRTHCASR